MVGVKPTLRLEHTKFDWNEAVAMADADVVRWAGLHSPEPGPWFLAVPGHPIYAYPAWLEEGVDDEWVAELPNDSIQ